MVTGTHGVFIVEIITKMIDRHGDRKTPGSQWSLVVASRVDMVT